MESPDFGPDALVELVNGAFADPSGPTRLENALTQLKQSATHKMVIHFHGGLVDGKAAHEMAADLYPTYQQAGAVPLFFVWHTGLLDIVKQKLLGIGEQTLFQQLVRQVARFALAKLPASTERTRGGALELISLKQLPDEAEQLAAKLDELEAAAGIQEEVTRSMDGNVPQKDLSPKDEDTFKQELQKDMKLRREVDALATSETQSNSVTTQVPDATESVQLLNDSVRTQMQAAEPAVAEPDVESGIKKRTLERGAFGDGALLVVVKHALQVLRRVLARYQAGRHHGLHATIVEEVLAGFYVDKLGGHFWKEMKKLPAAAFAENGGGQKLLVGLKTLWEEPASPPPCIMLVGHSAGSIYIGAFLEAADKMLPANAQFDVVLLAPAATFDFWHSHSDTISRRVRRLRLFALSDEVERSYWEVPLVYRGSLLYLVASLFERKEGQTFDPATADVPILGMARYHSAESPYDAAPLSAVLAQLKKYGEPVWVRGLQSGKSLPAGTAGAWSEAQRHGDFDDDPRTRESLAHLLTSEWHCL